MTPHNSDPVALAQPDLSAILSEAGSNGNPLHDPAESGNTEDFNYDPVLPKKIITVSVCYRISGRGQPLLCPLDEFDVCGR